jgi:hypothetical protein
MTPQTTNASNSAAEAVERGEAGAPEVTEEMLDVGFASLVKSGVIENPIEADRFAIERAFRKMFRLLKASPN